MIDFIQALIDKGAAYNVDGNVYFNIEAAKTMENYLRKILKI